jgi:CHASE2 domain-containing sensor protein
MEIEYLLYIVVPLFLGYIGERYKDMRTSSYAVLIFILLLAVNTVLAITYGNKIIPSLDILLMGLLGGGSIVGLFHLQKYLRRKKKNGNSSV